MADVQAFTLWSSTPGNNKPAGTDVIGAGLDDNLREIQGQISGWRDGTGYGILLVTGVSGTASSITGTTAPAPALTSGQKFLFSPGSTSIGGVSLSLNSGAFKSVTKQSSGGQVALTANDLLPTNQYLIEYDGTEYVLLNSRPYSQGANIATAGTINLDTATGDYLHLTGAVTVTAATLAVGEFRTTVTDSTPLFKNSASLILPGGGDIQAAAGDVQAWRGEASGVVRCVSYVHSVASPSYGGLAKNMVYNGSCRVLAEAAKSISTSPQYGKVDMWACWATGTAVTAGTVTQDSAASIGTYGKALHISGLTVTGTGIALARQRIPATDAVFYKNKTCTFSATVLHDVGSSINYTVVLRKPTVSDNYGSTTTIGTSSAQTVTTGTGTQITFTQAMGDCSNGIEIEIQAACGAVTTKNFRFSDMQLEEGSVTEFEQTSILSDRNKCGYMFEKTYDQGTDPATATDKGMQSIGIPTTGGAGNALTLFFRYPKRSTTVTVLAWDHAGNNGKWSERNGGVYVDNKGPLSSVATSENGAIFDSGDTTQLSNALVHFTADVRL